MSATFQSFASSTSSICNKPTGTVAGDLLVYFMISEGASTSPSMTGWTTDATFTATGGSPSNTARMAVAHHVAGASEPASYDFNGGTGSTSDLGVIFRVSGYDSTTPVDATSTYTTGGSALTSWPLPGMTASVSGDLFLAGVWDWNDGGISTMPLSGTVDINDPSDFDAGHAAVSASGATGTLTFSMGSSSGGIIGVLVKAASSGALTWTAADSQTNHDAQTVALTPSAADSQANSDSLGPVAYVPVFPADSQTNLDAFALNAYSYTPPADTQNNLDAHAATLTPTGADTQNNLDAQTTALATTFADSQLLSDGHGGTYTVTAPDSQANADGLAEAFKLTAADSQANTDGWTASLSGGLTWNATGDNQANSDAATWRAVYTPTADGQANLDAASAAYAGASLTFADSQANLDGRSFAYIASLGDNLTNSDSGSGALTPLYADSEANSDGLAEAFVVTFPADSQTNLDGWTAVTSGNLTWNAADTQANLDGVTWLVVYAPPADAQGNADASTASYAGVTFGHDSQTPQDAASVVYVVVSAPDSQTSHDGWNLNAYTFAPPPDSQAPLDASSWLAVWAAPPDSQATLDASAALISSNIPAVAATFVARDGIATFVARDGVVRFVARDGTATLVARDGTARFTADSASATFAAR